MFPHVFRELVVRDTDIIVPYTLDLQVDADYFIPHRHHFIEYSFVIKGSGTETINGKTHPLQPGTMSLMLPYQVHAIHSDPKNPISFYVGGISLEKTFGLDETGGELEKLLFHDTDVLPNHVVFEGELADRLKIIFSDMLKFIQKNDVWSHYLFLARIMEALVIFDEHRKKLIGYNTEKVKMSDDNKNRNNMENQTGHDQTFWKIVNHIQMHANEPLTLGMISEKFHISVSSISAGFKKLMGENYLSYLHGVRIQSACALLRSSELSIMDIALDVGYDSYETFARVFRQKKGVSAMAYRKNVERMEDS